MKRGAQIAFCSIFLIGVFLRLFLLYDQIPLNDDWHGLMYAATHSPSELLGSSSSFAHTSPLMNVYRWLLLHLVGWSELLLFLPSVLTGMFSLLVFPHLVRKVHGGVTALLFLVFLSISPLLVFYSRTGRPYGPLVFFLFLSVYSGGFWLLSNKAKYFAGYAFSAIVALYLHPVAVVTIFTPLLAGGACTVLRKPLVKVPLFRICLFGGLLGLISILILRPAATMTGAVMVDNPLPAFSEWRQVALMFFGTSSGSLAFLLLIVSLSGAVIVLRKNIFWGFLFALIFALNFLMIWVGLFAAANVAIVLVRYLIILCPVGLLWVAVALDRLSSISRVCGVLGSAGIFVLLVATSPLWEIYKAPNNFTNHSAFQESYETAGLQMPRYSRMFPWLGDHLTTSLPAFYQALPVNADCLIEYPMMIGDHCNLYYYYQQRHKKRVVVGYTMDVPWEMDRTDGVYGSCLINHVFREVKDKCQIRFHNIVNIQDAAAVQKTGADYLVVHLNLMIEMYGGAIEPESGRLPAAMDCLVSL